MPDSVNQLGDWPDTSVGELTPASLEQLTIAQIQALVADGQVDGRFWSLVEKDRRVGVRRLAIQARQRRRREEAEAARLERLTEVERRHWGTGISRIGGVDEVGRGCLAGPVVAAAVILPPGTGIHGLNDSKLVAPQRRQELRAIICDCAVAVGIGIVDAARIDRVNILEASMEAMRQAVAGLEEKPQRVLVDGNRLPGSGLPETAIVGGDARSITIAAASIVAKVHRDELMVAFDAEYPGYGFAKHKGYASAEHLRALSARGPCALHRHTFHPIAPREKGTAGQLPLGVGGGDVGERGEREAGRYLEEHGFHILERRYRGAGGEIDLIARDGECVVFVEVKTSQLGSLTAPESRVGQDKRDHLTRAALHYLGGCHPQPECRFDVVAIRLGKGPPVISHFADAFHVRRP
ncbi:ribonuclease HII [Candidatus Latescibacterota bacterium]